MSDMYIFRAQGRLTTEKIKLWLGRGVIPMLRRHHSEDDKVATLFRVIANIEDDCRRKRPEITAVLSRYSKGQRMMGYKITVPDLLKSTRKIDNWGIPVVTEIRQTVLKLPYDMPLPRSFQYTRLDSQSGIRSLDSSEKTRSHVLTNTFWRNFKRPLLATGSAIYSWAPFAPLFRKSPVIVIGSGHGAVARVALDGGCPWVYGVDLRSSIPLKAHRFRSFKPPLVQSSEYADKYTQLSESYTTSGDWFDPEVSRRILAYDQGDATVVIDIEAGRDRYGLEILLPVIASKTHGLIVIRLFLSKVESDQIAADLYVSGFAFAMYDGYIDTDVSERIIVIARWTRELKVCHFTATSDSLALSTSLFEPEGETTHKYLALGDATFNVVTLCPDQTLGDMKLLIDRVLSESVGDYDSRFSYEQWTRYLRAACVVQWLVLPDSQALTVLLEMEASREAQVMVRDKLHRVEIDWYFCKHIASSGSRAR
jgi:hypothetical protein